jgi:hypothetical protein
MKHSSILLAILITGNCPIMAAYDIDSHSRPNPKTGYYHITGTGSYFLPKNIPAIEKTFELFKTLFRDPYNAQEVERLIKAGADVSAFSYADRNVFSFLMEGTCNVRASEGRDADLSFSFPMKTFEVLLKYGANPFETSYYWNACWAPFATIVAYGSGLSWPDIEERLKQLQKERAQRNFSARS